MSQDTSLKFKGAADGIIHNNWGILHLPSFQYTKQWFAAIPPPPSKGICRAYSVTPVKVHHISHSPLIHIASPFISKGSQFALGKPASPFPDHILVLGAGDTGCQEDTAPRSGVHRLILVGLHSQH